MKISKLDSSFIKGIALIMMILHHTCNTNLTGQLSIIFTPPSVSDKILSIISGHCKFCVAIFAFLSGWVFWELKDKFCSYKYVINKCYHFMIAYWVVAFIFIFIGIISSDKIPDFNTLIWNLLGVKVGAKEIMHYEYINVVFAWYVRFYICVLLTIPIILRIIDKNILHYSLLLAIPIVLCILTYRRDNFIINEIFHVYFQWIPCIIIGVLCNKQNWLDKMKESNKYLLFLLFIGLLFLRFKKMTFYGDISTDFIMVVFFVYYIKILIKYLGESGVCFKILTFLGTLSMNIWYCHSIFFIPSHKWTWMIKYSDNVVLVILNVIALSVIFAYMCQKLQNKLNKIL